MIQYNTISDRFKIEDINLIDWSYFQPTFLTLFTCESDITVRRKNIIWVFIPWCFQSNCDNFSHGILFIPILLHLYNFLESLTFNVKKEFNYISCELLCIFKGYTWNWVDFFRTPRKAIKLIKISHVLTPELSMFNACLNNYRPSQN